MKNLTLTVIALAFFAFSLGSCSSEACFEDIDPLVVTDLYSVETGKVLKCDSISVIGIGADFDTLLVYNKGVSTTSFSLDPLHNQAVYIVKINKETDTVTITYSNYPHLISPECGFTIYNEIIEPVVTTHHIIDTITVDNKSVTLNGERNLRLFY